MFEIEFNGSRFAKVKLLEDAVSLSLAVHRSSNLCHKVDVIDDGRVVLSFFSEGVELPTNEQG